MSSRDYVEMSVTCFIEAFRKMDWVQFNGTDDSDLKDYFLAPGGMLDRVRVCQKFSFGNIQDTFCVSNEGANLGTLRDTAIQFYTNGIDLCPFSNCWFEWSIKHRKTFQQVICVVAAEDGAMYFHPFFLDKSGVQYDHEAWVFTGWVHRLSSDGVFSRFLCAEGYEFDDCSDAQIAADEFAVSLSLASMALLMARETKVTEKRPPAGLAAHRLKKGKAPLFSHKVVTIDPAKIVYSGGTAGDGQGSGRASPRLHWRRGHVRTLGSGKKVGIPPCVVGAAEHGVVDKTYRVRPTPEHEPERAT